MNKVISFLLIGLVKLYRLFISPILPNSCRYLPTCSEYMIESIKVHRPVKGTILGAKRLLKCHPFGGEGFDPVKKHKNSI